MSNNNLQHEEKYTPLLYNIMIPIIIIVVAIVSVLSVMNYLSSRNNLLQADAVLKAQTENNIQNAMEMKNNAYRMLEKSLDRQMRSTFEDFQKEYQNALSTMDNDKFNNAFDVFKTEYDEALDYFKSETYNTAMEKAFAPFNEEYQKVNGNSAELKEETLKSKIGENLDYDQLKRVLLKSKMEEEPLRELFNSFYFSQQIDTQPIKNILGNKYNLSPFVARLKENIPTNELKEDFKEFYIAQNIDLESLQAKYGENMNFYIIDQDGWVMRTTFTPDLNLNFRQWGGFYDFLTSKREGEGYTSDRISPSVETGALTKYSYYPTADNRFLLELGLNSSEFKEEIEQMDTTQIAESIKSLNPSLDRVRILQDTGTVLAETKSDDESETTVGKKVNDDIMKIVLSLFETEKDKYIDEENNTRYIFVELKSEGTIMDRVVELTYNTKAIDDKLSRLFWFSILTGFIALALSIGIVIFIAKMISDPIKKIIDDIAVIADGKLEHQIEVQTNNELKILKQSINTMSTKLKQSFDKIKDYSEHLEDKVEERTKELQEAKGELEKAFEEVTGLKVQQDGDYFLTSLLVNPLSVNNVESNTIDISFFFSQKKKFSFRDRNAELGGDISIAHSIILHDENNFDREYVVYVNGDAMGKSIQGAGGSLVLGTVFNALVNRTKFVPGLSDVSAEEWLIRCFRELQDIFASFDGTMLISVVMGIIDNETGMMYFFNAEHPWTVIYRNETATFIEDELKNRKIGNTVGFEKVKIEAFKLQPGDVAIAGSDGRDDLLLGYDDETGMRIINEDETLFLKAVEEGKGELKNIVTSLKKRGDLTDDLSLLKIAFKPNEKFIEQPDEIPSEFFEYKSKAVSAYERKDYKGAVNYFDKAIRTYSEQESYNKFIISCMKIEQYERALALSEKAILEYPNDLKIMFKLSLLNKKAKQFEKAIYYGKRYRIYRPDDVLNLINLADSHRLLKQYKKARDIIKYAKKLKPTNTNIL